VRRRRAHQSSDCHWLFLKSAPYWVAGLGGALVAALWNFFTTASFTWGPRTAARR